MQEPSISHCAGVAAMLCIIEEVKKTTGMAIELTLSPDGDGGTIHIQEAANLPTNQVMQ